MKRTLLVVAGALAGGALGHVAFFWLAAQGFYALALPGVLLGFGAGVARNRSTVVAVGCGLAALVLGLVTEWRYAPFVKDPGFVFFVGHAAELKPVTLVMIALGALVGFWVPFRRAPARQ